MIWTCDGTHDTASQVCVSTGVLQQSARGPAVRSSSALDKRHIGACVRVPALLLVQTLEKKWIEQTLGAQYMPGAKDQSDLDEVGAVRSTVRAHRAQAGTHTHAGTCYFHHCYSSHATCCYHPGLVAAGYPHTGVSQYDTSYTTDRYLRKLHQQQQ